MTYHFKATHKDSLIEQRNRNSLTHLIRAKDKTIEEKQELIKERNPYLFAFGDHLTPQKPYEDYADWVNRLYIGARYEPRTI